MFRTPRAVPQQPLSLKQERRWGTAAQGGRGRACVATEKRAAQTSAVSRP